MLYSEAEEDLAAFAHKRNIPVVETQAGKGALDWEEELNFGSPGVTGSEVANRLCAEADLVIGVGTRFQDFTTGSWTVFANPKRRLVSINLAGYDAAKHNAIPLVGDAKVAIARIDAALGERSWPDQDRGGRKAWFEAADAVMAAPNHAGPPTDAQVIGAVQRQARPNTVAMCAAGIVAARSHDIPSVIVIETDPVPGTGAGGHWWDVAVRQAGGPERLEKAREKYHAHVATQRLFD